MNVGVHWARARGNPGFIRVGRGGGGAGGGGGGGGLCRGVGSLSFAGPVDQRYLFEARQMQALSLSVHIPLVCFGIAFPALVLFAEWRYLRTGDVLYRTLARRWSKIILALFAG